MSAQKPPPHAFFRRPAADADISCRVLLYGLQSPINIGMALRVAETFQVPIGLYDPSAVLENADKLKTVRDFGCGALERAAYGAVSGPEALTKLAKTGRIVATTVVEGAQPLPQFKFKHSDIVLIGNEYDGLPAEVERLCVAAVHIPMANVWTPKPKSESPIDAARTTTVARDGTPSLNAAMSAGIVCYSAFLAREKKRARARAQSGAPR
ncbi:TrmH family RNA methyltransferase [Terricaulis sp.]|uniref:TrmH family RNA methyltransferase n=1 Tax=Terricaulis sp. TaxID=2768686 RepID=UPI0037845F81